MFTNEKPIFQQMADRLCDEILAQTYQDDERIPSVREYAVMLEVNTNTAVKAYELLSRENIIYNKRGLGSSSPPVPVSKSCSSAARCSCNSSCLSSSAR